MDQHQLLLYPEQPDYTLSREEIATIVQRVGLAGPSHGTYRWLAGDAFLNLIGFLGCAPAIELEPRNDKPFCFVAAPEPLKEAHLLTGKNSTPPKCSNCGQLQRHLVTNPGTPTPFPSGYRCPDCQTRLTPATSGWRKTAAFARIFIVIHDIHEQEAAPSDLLLGRLKRETGVNWKYCYLRIQEAVRTKKREKTARPPLPL